MAKKYDLRNMSVEEWFNELDQGLNYRRLYGLEESWNDVEALYYNTHTSLASDSPNIIASTGAAFVSELTVPQPYMLVEPTREESVDGAPILESVLNNIIYDIDLPNEIETAVLHAYLWGRGTLKIGFDSEFGYKRELDLGAKYGAELGMSLSQFDKKGRRIEFGGARPGMPWVQAVLPHDLVVPWGARTLDKSPWLAHRVIRHVDDVRSDPKYKFPQDLQPVMSMEDYVKSYQTVLKPYRIGWQPRQVASRKAEFCELWEIRSARTGRIMTLATGSSKKLRDDNDLLLTEEGYPFVSFSFVPRTRNFWVTSDAYYLRFHQAEQTDIALQASKQRRMGVLRFFYDGDVIDSDEVNKITKADVGVGIKVEGSKRSVREAVHFVQPGNNMLLWQDAEAGRRNANEVVGFSRNDRGEYEPGRRTAEEVRNVSRGSGSRMGRRVKILKSVYVKTCRKMSKVLSVLWKAPRIAQIMGINGEPIWQRYTGADLRGKYRFISDFSTEAGETLQTRRQRALTLYTMLKDDPMVAPAELRRYLVKAFNDPELGKVLRLDSNADLRLLLSQMSGKGRGTSGGGSPQKGRLLPQM